MRRSALYLLPALTLLLTACPEPKPPSVPDGRVANVLGGPDVPDTKVLSGNTEPLVVDWHATARGNLETTMRDGIAIVAISSQGMKLLPGCHVDGKYGFIGMSMKEQVVRLESADEVKANLPLGGLGLAAQIGGEFQQGATLDVALVMIGKMRTTWRNVRRADLQGDCAGATHFVRSAMVGAFAMEKGQKREARAAAQIFGLGAGGGTKSTAGLHQSDGMLDECRKADPDMPRPPGQCAALVRLDLQEIQDERANPKPQTSTPTPAEVDVVKCPQGMVSVNGKCTNANSQQARAYECSGERAKECMDQCNLGNLPSCTKRAIMGLNGTNGATKEPFNAAKLLAVSCRENFARACSVLGYVFADPNLVQKPDLPESFKLMKRGCDGGDELGCYGAGGAFLFGRGVAADRAQAIRHLAKACEGGSHGGCSDLGVLFLTGKNIPKDPAKAAVLFKSACDGDNASGCGNLAYLAEAGLGMQQNQQLALRLYEKACRASDEACEGAAIMLQLGKGVTKNESGAVALHKKACAAQNVLSCAFLRTYVDPSTRVDVENAKNALTVWSDTCQNGLSRDCTQAAVIAYSVGLKQQGDNLMSKSCQMGDDWACANTKLRVKNDGLVTN